MTWAKREHVTVGSTHPNFRPLYVENASDDWNLLWHSDNFWGITKALAPRGGNSFDRFDDVLILNELLINSVSRD